jgi:hypothetical protein
MMEAETVSETPDTNFTSTQLIALEDFTVYCFQESFKYVSVETSHPHVVLHTDV